MLLVTTNASFTNSYYCFYLLQLNLADLWQVDNELARGLKQLLDFPEGGHSIEDTFGSTFAVSRNPLIDNVIVEEGRKSVGQYIELIPGGQDIFVNRSNRQRFVDEFVRYALQRCCNGAINQYFQGLQVLFPARFINMSSHEELEHLICGSTEIGDLSELRIHTTYRGRFNDEHQVVNWFWVSIILPSLSMVYFSAIFVDFLLRTHCLLSPFCRKGNFFRFSLEVNVFPSEGLLT